MFKFKKDMSTVKQKLRYSNIIKAAVNDTSLFPGSKAFSISARTSMIPRAFWISVRLNKGVWF